ncbi:hypothetical protein TVAG_261680 [Trichomonas vaginalis G3]|uniref:SCP domain-containing protein n=1 Tax=Trichomonas vaginalis (strain ATCC PRA-98 / G3) TaxID=412133 RepID=A2FQ25_TRIV3|nr:DNA-directed 5'-3' RNA polymerase protein [Trichomonas vaginalis G3]EAX92989.1 hypothetical protein TVAG_261680 [Trichomonas vaginalis G3]KAI5508107.1 DNA-directed 5'-3' RNA polymerase protein [Trichomonas vaginalis G3]|eukprot:XP_001305919.1 hypothetical protein [Trichomonas vaginalis G3]
MLSLLCIVVKRDNSLNNRRRSEFCRRYRRDNYAAKSSPTYGYGHPTKCIISDYDRETDRKNGIATLNFYRWANGILTESRFVEKNYDDICNCALGLSLSRKLEHGLSRNDTCYSESGGRGCLSNFAVADSTPSAVRGLYNDPGEFSYGHGFSILGENNIDVTFCGVHDRCAFRAINRWDLFENTTKKLRIYRPFFAFPPPGPIDRALTTTFWAFNGDYNSYSNVNVKVNGTICTMK